MGTTFIRFNPALDGHGRATMSFSVTFRCALMNDSWTPDNDTSTIASLTSVWCTSASGGQADRRCQPPNGGSLGSQWAYVSDGVYKFDLSDVAITATAGQEIDARYGLIYASAAMRAEGYWEISVTAVAAQQFTAQFPSAGIFDTSR